MAEIRLDPKFMRIRNTLMRNSMMQNPVPFNPPPPPLCTDLQELFENVEPGVGNVAHGVLEGPDDGVQHQLELLGRDGEEGGETVQVNRLKYKAHFRIGT